MAMAGLRTAKYQLPEWHRRNAGVCCEALRAGERAERGRAEAAQLVKHAAASAQRAQQRSKATLGQRLQDVHFWRMELQKEIMELDAETKLLAAQKLRLERALDATEVPYAVVVDNLDCRERRQPPDLVIDEVERQLLKRLHTQILGRVQPRQHFQGGAGEAGVGAAALADQQRHPRRVRGPARAARRHRRGLQRALQGAGRGQAAPGAAPGADPEGYWGGGSQHCKPEKSHQGEGSSPEGGSHQALRPILPAQRRALQG
ncbi:Tektin-4 [Lonchura striata]|uniref:Tektin n=1 Tax=Lonchura striata TaxID=40157 RepID=A0A218UWC9_9PASE|nr:Tektin-4 [Lonchura striata domestica]